MVLLPVPEEEQGGEQGKGNGKCGVATKPDLKKTGGLQTLAPEHTAGTDG